MKARSNLLYLIVLLTSQLSVLSSYGQSNPVTYSISGTVVDSATQAILPFVTTSLKAGGNAPLKAAVSDTNGAFIFTGLQPLQYTLTVVAIGYTTKSITIDLTSATIDKMELGAVYINKKTNKLKEVTVSAFKPIIKQEADRISYDLQADPDSKSSSVMDMMRKVPYVSVGADGNILLKNNSSYKIFINGKPSGIMDTNPKEVLQSMPASTIQRIEVITNPPARYDAEGLAGIINIITNKDVKNGYNGTVNLNAKYPQGGPGIGASINARTGRFGVSAFAGGSLSFTPVTDISNTRQAFTAFPSTLTQQGTKQSDTRTGYFGTELSYEIDSIHLLAAQFNFSKNRTDGTIFQDAELTRAKANLQKYQFSNDNNNRGNSIDAAINYQRGFKHDKNRLLTFSYRYVKSANNMEDEVLFDNRVNYDYTNYQQYNRGTATEHTVQVDYAQGIKALLIEAGAKGIFRLNKSDYRYLFFNPNNGKFEVEPALSNDFINHQNVFSFYNAYTYQLREWGFKAGVRVEETVIDVDFSKANTVVKQQYFNIVPTASISRKFKDKSMLTFGFNQRIKRPGINKLNPYVDRSDPNYESTGNPELRPSTINNFMLSYGRSGKLSANVGVGFSFFRNLDLRISSYNPVTNITRTTFDNVGKGTAVTSDINLTYAVTKRWNASVNSSLVYLWMDGVSDSSLIQVNRLMYNVNITTGYRFDKGWRLSANLNITGAGIVSLQGVSNAFVSNGITLGKDLLQDRLSLAATVNNPFQAHRDNRIVTTGHNFIETNNTYEFFRTYQFILNYRFGQLKEKVKKNKRGINNDDLSNSKGGL
ncbi:outer membrane beta-barrel protein [Chitinophaga nivalis]|uniref:TonB-dependent receptor n=1 Tax=Chitinophaga nivalis TaxID=2991709 RepID=A0ABT3IJR2_9BACT|nr:outer membrane beta-barrel protein [Chitinophaga nivalis]MCW3466094.1 TonB-dependent receptor [Chitinophaga nivalis]MCW3484215.1 TonB-dependent receptor [Chitinophaga nivalis]